MQLRIGISAILFLAAMGSQAPARENDTYIVGVNKCFNWCDAHNSTQKSRSSCYGRCVAYWLKNASDAALIHSPALPLPTQRPAIPVGPASPVGAQ